MKKQKALEYFGGSITRLTRAASVKPPSYYDWGDLIPVISAIKIEDSTKGALRVDWRAYGLRKRIFATERKLPEARA